MKSYAFLATQEQPVRVHISQIREGEKYERSGVPVIPVVRNVPKKFFRYAPGAQKYTGFPMGDFKSARESDAHLVTKSIIHRTGRLFCKVGSGYLLLALVDMEIEKSSGSRRPDITGIVGACYPYWNFVGKKMHIEIHFENAVRDPQRIKDLASLGDPVLEFHLPKNYLAERNDLVSNPEKFESLLLAVTIYGKNAGTWVPGTFGARVPFLEDRNTFDFLSRV